MGIISEKEKNNRTPNNTLPQKFSYPSRSKSRKIPQEIQKEEMHKAGSEATF